MINAEQMTKDFEKHQIARNFSASTIETEGRMLMWFFEFLAEETVENITDVDTTFMLKYQIYLSAIKNNKGKPYNPRTQNLAVSTVRKLFRYLRKKGEVFCDPTQGMELAKAPRPLPRNILSVKEMNKLLSQPNAKKWVGGRDNSMLEILYSTAMRQGELLHLDLNDLNPDDGTILIRDTKGRRDRVVPCGKEAWRRLKHYLRTVRPLLVENINEQAVFLNKYGNRLSKQGLLTLVKTYALKAGIKKNISAHNIRHSAATHMADNGCDIRILQLLLGHSSANTTAVYLHTSISKLKLAHQKFDPREKTAETRTTVA